jgi:hypothetical protein
VLDVENDMWIDVKRRWVAPWTPEQCAALNERQFSGQVHPYTCGNDSSHPPLIAIASGWTCLGCDYTQDWAHAMDIKSQAPEHLTPTMTNRGFLHLPPIEGFHAGRPDGKVRVYESSAASGPHIWINVEGNYVTPEFVQRGVDVSIHLPLEDALKLAEQIKWLVRSHYQIQPRRGN